MRRYKAILFSGFTMACVGTFGFSIFFFSANSNPFQKAHLTLPATIFLLIALLGVVTTLCSRLRGISGSGYPRNQ